MKTPPSRSSLLFLVPLAPHARVPPRLNLGRSISTPVPQRGEDGAKVAGGGGGGGGGAGGGPLPTVPLGLAAGPTERHGRHLG